MKKILLIALMAALLVPFVMLNGRNTKAASVFDNLSFPGGTNLIDSGNITERMETDDVYVYGTFRNVFLENNSPILLQIDLNGQTAPTGDGVRHDALFKFYTIDGFECGSQSFDEPTVLTDSKNREYKTYYINAIPENAFSMKIEYIYGLPQGFIFNGGLIMGIRSTTPQPYEWFVAHGPLIDITGSNHPVIKLSYEDVLTKNEIKWMIGARDGYSGNLAELLTITCEEYLLTPSRKGEYPVTVTVSDGTNSQEGLFYINVVDEIAPVITGNDEVKIPVGTTINDAFIRNQFTAIDGYDGNITNSIQVIGEYTKVSDTIKTENITIEVRDSSNNVTTKEVTLNFYDNVAPVITGPETITFSYQVSTDIHTIIGNNFTITDNIDENPIYVLTKNEYTGHERKLGTYEVIINAKDASKNASTKTISITVVDDIPPIIYLDTYQIEASPSIILSSLDFSNILYKSGELSKGKKYSAKVLNDTYTGHENEKGTYMYQVQYTSEDGEELVKTFKINVDFDSYAIDYNAIKGLSDNMIRIGVLSIMLVASLSVTLVLIKKKKNYR